MEHGTLKTWLCLIFRALRVFRTLYVKLKTKMFASTPAFGKS
jgi:hypothetical protein